ncbi:methyltransferase domain-containing protein [Caulobacter sp. 1776]|uniref:class I SAM-dependent methyltransferase n=1 Tax=Caulobacter sp. 1776 TaxID=3156420 RepID=UPI003398D80E
MTGPTHAHPALGLTIHRAARYDFLVWLLTLGGETRLRRRILALADPRPGEHVLDIGCGTGTSAILAKRAVGRTGSVRGVDPSPEMLARAHAKARAAGVDVVFEPGAAQALPQPDASVDLVLSTFMLHHIPVEARQAMGAEIRRVLKPGGRAVLVDFGRAGHVHHHGFVDMDKVAAELSVAGLAVRRRPLGAMGLDVAIACPDPAKLPVAVVAHHRSAKSGPLHMLAAIGALAALAVLITLHVGLAVSLQRWIQHLPRGLAYGLTGLVAAIVILKIGVLGVVHRFGSGVFAGWVGARHRHGDR